MLKRLKRAYKAFKVPPEVPEKELEALLNIEPLGDGQAEFLPEMTEEEYNNYVRDEQQGWKNFRKRLGL